MAAGAGQLGGAHRRGSSSLVVDARLFRPAAEDAAPSLIQGSIDSRRADLELRSRAEPLLLRDLLNDLATLAPLLAQEVARGSWLDAYLLAAGMHQIVEDFLHRDPYGTDRIAKHVRALGPRWGVAAGEVASRLGDVLWHVRALGPWSRRLSSYRARLTDVVDLLASVVVTGGIHPAKRSELESSSAALVRATKRLPRGLLREVIRLPACFRGFDQRPDDVWRLMVRFAERWPDRRRPVLVVGVRTSGAYLAPLCAASLRAIGYDDVSILTLRPGQRLLAAERRVVLDAARRSALVLLTDDPPSSGGTVSRAAGDLQHIGVSEGRIVLALQLFGGRSTLPQPLQRYEAVLLEWQDWSVHESLEPHAVERDFAAFLGPSTNVSMVERITLPTAQVERGHMRAVYRVRLTSSVTGGKTDRVVCVDGAGLGYLGRHAVVVADALRGYVPEVFGCAAGLLYRVWLPEASLVEPVRRDSVPQIADEIASYVVARNRALRVDQDMSQRLGEQRAVWQRSSGLLSQAFGRAAPLSRLALGPLARRLLQVNRPSVIDGNTALSRWFGREDGTTRLVKVGFAGAGFAHRDPPSYDPVFDLAGAAASARVRELAVELRRSYERRAGEPIDEERWLLYQLVHLQRECEHARPQDQAELQRAQSRALHSYVAATIFNETRPAAQGPLCAFDIDGVLESGWLGFASMSPAACLALRALSCHGYRGLLATGRSIEEVRDRCESFGLAGGVAEYGSVIYMHDARRVEDLLTTTDRRHLGALRRTLLEMDGVIVDAAYRRSVRASLLDDGGDARALSAELIDSALARSGTRPFLRAIQGGKQTDFVPTRIDKGVGVRVLAARLGVAAAHGEGRVLALAVGDTESDLPLFRLAELALAPANVDAHVRAAGVRVLSESYQRGAARAVAVLLGHQPGGCPTCRFAPSQRRGLLLTALGAQDAGKVGKLVLVALLGRRLVGA